MGAIVAGGGAALGTGAFSTVEADRDVDVNIIDENDLAEEFLDITLKASDYDSVGLDAEDDDNNDDISVIANDVTIVFGPGGNELPPNVEVTYEDLFEIENDGADSPDFQVDFDVTGADSVFTFDPDNPTVEGDQTEDVTLDLETNGESESGTLEITITEQ